MSGLFIVFEGGEGAGKSTLAAKLAESLHERGINCLLDRQPGGSHDLGPALRAMILNDRGAGSAPLSAREETLLFLLDRARHVSQVIRPALERGTVVICDRYAGSTIAYQGAARGLGEADVERMSDWASAGLWPDLTFLLDVDPQLGLDRAGRRGEVNRLELESLEFHWRVREAFTRLVDEHQGWTALNATQPVEELHRKVLAKVLRHMHEVTQEEMLTISR